MTPKGLADGDVLDLERGVIAGEDDGPGAKSAKSLVNRVCNGSSGAEEPADSAAERGESPLVEKKFGGEEETLGLMEKKTEAEKQKKKKAGKKPPKPPRVPRAASLDACDQKLIQQISELAMLKRARTERMKALMKTKNSKPASSSSSFWALVITVLFCLVIVWQGFCTRSHPRASFAGSPESSVRDSRMIQVQYLRNAFPGDSSSPASASPSVMERSLEVGGAR